MNDPEEGKLLHKWLGAEEESIDQVSPFYLMSLTTESDDLPMWVQYGRDGKGICVTLHDDLFEVKNSRAEHELIPRATDLKQQEDGKKQMVKTNQKFRHPKRENGLPLIGSVTCLTRVCMAIYLSLLNSKKSKKS